MTLAIHQKYLFISVKPGSVSSTDHLEKIGASTGISYNVSIVDMSGWIDGVSWLVNCRNSRLGTGSITNYPANGHNKIVSFVATLEVY